MGSLFISVQLILLMTGQEILGSLQEDIDRKKGKFIELMREFHLNQPLDKKTRDEVERARVEWLIAINHLKVSLPFLGANDLVNSLLVPDQEIKKA
ncbi:MAG: hypothetical protein JWN56_710 [Sphingobacteriales bacterium]|nr:hypothetical protein [Sphingobacteriales bacterium]